MTLHLVRHGRPAMTPGVPAAAWDLDPTAYDDVWALRSSGLLPARAAWFTSPEPKARRLPGAACRERVVPATARAPRAQRRSPVPYA